ncbi:MAG: 4Fe-4S binding protein [bacterium]|nr:4Fe-4S binding protein [bacterium]
MLRALITLGGLGAVLSTIIAIAYSKLAVHVSERHKRLLSALPGSNCGACGFPGGCEGYAKFLEKGETDVGLCVVGGRETAEKLAEILGVEAKITEPKVAILRCCGDKLNTYERFNYIGIKGCTQANILAEGPKSCRYGCLGFGDCVEVCTFDAIKMGENGLPVIDDKKCTGCGNCVKVCPKNIIELIPKAQKIYVACSSPDSAKATKTVCKTGCIGCGLCERYCPYSAIKVDNGCAKINFEMCQNCGICVYKCPTNTILDKLKSRPKAIIGTKCTGCAECEPVCPTKAISGKPGEQYRVTLDKCIGCSLCYKVCKPKAITMAFSLGYAEVV